MKQIGILSLLLILILSSCRKDINEDNIFVSTPSPTIENYEPKENLIQGDLIGFVVDEDDEPVVNVTVEVNGDITTTDDFGHFFMYDKTMNSLGTLAKIEKDGFFKGSRRFFPNAGQKNRVKVQLIRKEFINSFNATAGGFVSLADGASFELKPNSLRLASGEIYTGTAEVSSKWMNPVFQTTIDQIPGNLQGLNRNVEERALSMFGALALELQTTDGELLYLVEEETAIIKLPVPNILIDNAPNELSIWSYNETYGLWIEKTMAILEDGFYKGEVDDFSVWSMNTSAEFVILDVALVDVLDDPMVNYKVSMGYTNSEGFSFSFTYTDDSGHATLVVPKDEMFRLSISVSCGSLFNQEIGPYNENSNITITVDDPFIGVNSTIIKGTLYDCENEVVSNGMVKIAFNQYKIYEYADENGQFDVSFTSCDNPEEITVTGINLDLMEIGEEVVVVPNQETILNNLSTCGNSFVNFLEITIDGNSKTYEDAFLDSSFPNSSWIQLPFEQGGPWASITFEGSVAGDYSASMENVFDWPYDPDMGWDWINGFGHFTTFIVTQFDSQLVGTASGVLEGADMGADLPIEVSFSIAL